MKEIYKTIPDFEDYEVSNLGNVRSLKSNKILKQRLSGKYYAVNLNKNKCYTFRVHQLVAITFLNHKPQRGILCVDHIDNNPLNNNLDNLQVINLRKNCSKDKHKLNKTSKYVGVSKEIKKTKNKNYEYWLSTISINGKQIKLGLFKTELEASTAYQNKLKELGENM